MLSGLVYNYCFEIVLAVWVLNKIVSEGDYSNVPDENYALSITLWLDAVDKVTNLLAKVQAPLRHSIFHNGVSRCELVCLLSLFIGEH